MDDCTVFFVKLPQHQQLCHVVLKVKNANFHLQVLKCRHLLFLCGKAIAAPQSSDKSLIDAVIEVDFYKKKFAAFCHKLELKPVHTSIAKQFVIERCVLYTVKYRLSPQWNQVGCVLVNNANFLQCHEKMEAVYFEVSIQDTEMIMKVKPYQIRLNFPKLENFGICPEALQKFSEDSNYEIPESAINLNWCYILPSMNRGQVVRFSHKPPCDGCSGTMFKSYEDLYRYWKNQYGYHLPISTEDVIYCSVYFKQITSSLFTYPLVCLRNHSVQLMPRCNGPLIVKNFIRVVREKLNNLCGSPLIYSGKSCCSVNCLTVSSKIKPEIPQNIRICWDASESDIREVPNHSSSTSNLCNISLVPNKDIMSQNPGSERVSEQTVPVVAVNSLARSNSLNTLPINAEGKLVPIFGRKKNISVLNSKIPNNIQLGSAAESSVLFDGGRPVTFKTSKSVTKLSKARLKLPNEKSVSVNKTLIDITNQSSSSYKSSLSGMPTSKSSDEKITKKHKCAQFLKSASSVTDAASSQCKKGKFDDIFVSATAGSSITSKVKLSKSNKFDSLFCTAKSLS